MRKRPKEADAVGGPLRTITTGSEVPIGPNATLYKRGFL
jgi:hypothetical protein